MTYVSRRARITVPRWPNDFDPEFLFRVGRRCDGRLKRHSSCHDLRAWINDNCIKNEYLLDLMSDGEVTLRPPLQLYGRFIPVPLLFKLLQNSRSENGPDDIDWEKLVQRSAPLSDEEGDKKSKKSGVPFGEKDKSKGSVFFDTKDNKARVWGSPILRESRQGKDSRSSPGEDTQAGRVFGQGAPISGNEPVKAERRKWDPFEKMEYYTSGFAGKNSTLLEDFDLRNASTQSPEVMDDDNENRKCESQKSESEGSLVRVLCAKSITEKNLFKSTCLLTKAMGKLEKIDNIIQVGNEEREKMRKGEIQEAFHKPMLNCIYIQSKSTSEKTPCSIVKYRVKTPGDLERQETLKCNELLRQISGLREKLKKNQECQQKINDEIAISQKEAESGTFPHMTEVSRSEGEAHLMKLQKRLEKLINHRGKLLSDMCQALTNLNNLKRCKNSKVDLRQRSRSGENRGVQQEQCHCGCMNYQSSESEKAHCSDSGSSTDNQFRRRGGPVNYNSSTDNLDLGQQNLNDEKDTLNDAYASKGEFYKDNRQEKEGRKSTLRFCCPPCKVDPDAADWNGQLSYYQGPSANNPLYRPSTSPTTRRERWDVSEDRQFVPRGSASQEIPERRVKSETTMKEIEKTLRNYEQRLSDMDGLEYKVEEWKRKLLEACRWRRNAAKVEAQAKKELENEKNKATTEINGLFSQNCELKKQVRQLTDKSKEQAKKIQNMKSSVLKAKELENEAEELKKELSEYRDSYEHQRKCISKWESVVALQRKEIENLMNHIRKLTTEKKEQMTVYCQDRKCIQRTRSCSPVTLVDCQTYCRPETYNLRSEEENGSCCCQDFRQPDSRRNQPRFFDKNYYSSLNEREDWCN